MRIAFNRLTAKCLPDAMQSQQVIYQKIILPTGTAWLAEFAGDVIGISLTEHEYEALADLQQSQLARTLAQAGIEWQSGTTRWADALVSSMQATRDAQLEVPVLVQGTDFQCRIWQTLSTVTAGQVLSYQDLAHQADSPRGARAVGMAMAANPIPLLIPCHRVVLHNGKLGHYRWGPAYKQALLAFEQSIKQED